MTPSRSTSGSTSGEDAATEFNAFTRTEHVDGIDELHGIILPADVSAGPTDADAWSQAGRWIESWRTVAFVPGVRQTRLERTDQMLGELGWERADGRTPVPSGPIRVRRTRAAFRAHEVETDSGVIVVILDHSTGEALTQFTLDDGLVQTLEAHGWHGITRLDDWAGTPWLVAPFDWQRLIHEHTVEREKVQESARATDLRWRRIIREAVLAGISGPAIASVAGVSPQRVHQIAKEE